MNLFKKIVASVALFTLVAWMATTGVNAASDNNIASANKLAEAWIINNNSTNPANYNLGNNVLRQEIAKVAANIAGLTPKATSSNSFSDVSATTPNTWAFKYVEALLDKGLITANAKFNPESNISKSEALKMMLEAAGYKDIYTDSANWQAETVAFAVEKAIVTSFSDYKANATRGWVFSVGSASIDAMAAKNDSGDIGSLFNDLIGNLGDNTTSTPTDTTTSTNTGTNTGTNTSTTPSVSGTADVSVSLNPDSLANGSQIPNVGVVRFARVDFTAGSEDASLNTVKISKKTLASITSGTRIWFEQNGKRISGKAAFSSDNTAIVSFAPSYIVMAGETATLDLYVQLPDLGNNNTSGNDIQLTGMVTDASVTVNGDFTTPLLTTASYTVAPVIFTSLGGTNILYNDLTTAVELGKFKFQNADTFADIRDITFQSLTIRQLGNADLANLSDVYIERNGKKVSSSYTVDGKYITFAIDDMVKDSTTATYYVRGIVSNVDLSGWDSYNFELKKDTDLSAVEALNWFRSSVYKNLITTNANLANNVPIGTYKANGSDIVFQRDSAVELSTNVAKGTTNVTLMKGVIKSTSSITLEDPSLSYTSTLSGASDIFNTVYLKIGWTVMTWTPVSTDTATGWFLGLATLTAWDTPVEIYADLKDTAPVTTFKFGDLRLNSFVTAEYASNQNSITSSVWTVSWISVSIDSTAITVTKTDGLGNTTLASGSKGVTLNSVSLKVNTGNPTTISNPVYTVNYRGDAINNVFLTLYADGQAVSTKTFNTSTLAPIVAGKQISTVTLTDVGTLATYNVVINGTTYSLTDTGGIAFIGAPALATALAPLVDVNTSVSATASWNVITVTALTAGASFTITNIASTTVGNVVIATPTANQPAVDGTGSVVFQNLNSVVNSTTSVVLTVKADLSDAYTTWIVSTKLTGLDITDTLTSNTVTLPTVAAWAVLTVAQSEGQLAISSDTVNAKLLLAGSTSEKLMSFSVKARNDDVKIRDLAFVGTSLSSLSNFRVIDTNNTEVAIATSNTDTSVLFSNLNVTDVVSQDSTKTYYLVADVNSNTASATVNVTLNKAGSQIKGTNGRLVPMTWVPSIASKNHRVSENMLVMAKEANPSAALASSALRFNVSATGKDSVTLNTITLDSSISNYSTWTNITIYKDNLNNVVGTLIAASSSGANLAWQQIITLTGNNIVTSGTTSNYYVVFTNASVTGNNSSSYVVSLKEANVNVGTNTVININASTYSNIGSFPITETK